METNRKHEANAEPRPLRRASLGNPMAARPYPVWSGRRSNGAGLEATWTSDGTSVQDGLGDELPTEPPIARCGNLEVDRACHRAALAGMDLRLTRREYALLDCLVAHVNRVVSRSDLLESVWTLSHDYGSNVVDVYVRRLRQKFGQYAGLIETIRGFGYCLRPALRT